MIKKLLLIVTLVVFIFIDFGCIVVPPRTDPPPRKRTVKTRKPGHGYIWVQGHWVWKKSTWRWRNGYWVKNKKGKKWIPGRWRGKKSKKKWVKGHWIKR